MTNSNGQNGPAIVQQGGSLLEPCPTCDLYTQTIIRVGEAGAQSLVQPELPRKVKNLYFVTRCLNCLRRALYHWDEEKQEPYLVEEGEWSPKTSETDLTPS